MWWLALDVDNLCRGEGEVVAFLLFALFVGGAAQSKHNHTNVFLSWVRTIIISWAIGLNASRDRIPQLKPRVLQKIFEGQINKIASVWLWKYARIFFLGYYLFLKTHSFPRNSLSENCWLLGTENVRGQISEHIFAPNEGSCLYIVKTMEYFEK